MPSLALFTLLHVDEVATWPEEHTLTEDAGTVFWWQILLAACM